MATRRQPSKTHSRYRLHVQLHHILQAAMGWTDAHLHQFDINLFSSVTPKRIGVKLGAIAFAAGRFLMLRR